MQFILPCLLCICPHMLFIFNYWIIEYNPLELNLYYYYYITLGHFGIILVHRHILMQLIMISVSCSVSPCMWFIFHIIVWFSDTLLYDMLCPEEKGVLIIKQNTYLIYSITLHLLYIARIYCDMIGPLFYLFMTTNISSDWLIYNSFSK
jgi:hypothetical protein